MTLLPRSYIGKHWLPSIGEKPNKVHFREPPPGTGHAECDPNSELCEVHFDKVNPHQDLVGHLIEDSPQTLIGLIVGILVGSIIYIKRRNVVEAFLLALVFGILSYCIVKLLIIG